LCLMSFPILRAKHRAQNDDIFAQNNDAPTPELLIIDIVWYHKYVDVCYIMFQYFS
jgi:hypothetical protein